MGRFEEAIHICSALIMVILVPWGAIVYPALVQEYLMDNPAPSILLEAQGFHWIAAFVCVIILLILLAGAWLD